MTEPSQPAPDVTGQAKSNGNGAAGREHPKCGGKLKPPRSGTCGLPAGHGTDHVGIGRCKRHGGCTPTHRASARRVMVERAEAAALAELASLNLPPLGDPLTALARLAAESFHWLELIRGRVAAVESLTADDHLGDERIVQRVILLERAMDRAERFATSMARLGLDERIVANQLRITELAGAQWAGLFREVLRRLYLPPEIMARVPDVVAAVISEAADGRA